MSSDPKLTSALALGRALAALRACDDWELEAIEAGYTQEEGEYVVTFRLRWAEAAPADPEELKRHIL